MRRKYNAGGEEGKYPRETLFRLSGTKVIGYIHFKSEVRRGIPIFDSVATRYSLHVLV